VLAGRLLHLQGICSKNSCRVVAGRFDNFPRGP